LAWAANAEYVDRVVLDKENGSIGEAMPGAKENLSQVMRSMERSRKRKIGLQDASGRIPTLLANARLLAASVLRCERRWNGSRLPRGAEFGGGSSLCFVGTDMTPLGIELSEKFRDRSAPLAIFKIPERSLDGQQVFRAKG
jgi:hypothetical protein